VSPRGLRAVFERFRGILHDGAIDKRVQYTIESLFAVRKSGFADYPAVPEALDLVEKVGPLNPSKSYLSQQSQG
jgi:pre-mRNA-splicing factor CWC22